MLPEKPTPTSESLAELAAAHAALQREVDELKAARRALGGILVTLSRGLQSSTASIKAAVSSLLNHDIFWDPANQHEFLQAIDNSVGQMAQLAYLLAVTSRIDAEALDLRPEEYALQEIVMVARARTLTRWPQLTLDVSLAESGRPIRADFEYLTLALSLLLEVAAGRPNCRGVSVDAHEQPDGWRLALNDVDAAASQEVVTYLAAPGAGAPIGSGLPAQSTLQLYIVREILSRHSVTVSLQTDVSGKASLGLRFSSGPELR